MTPRERAALAYGYAASAVNGALEMGQYDGLMMPWAKSEHDGVMLEVLRIRDELRAKAAVSQALREAES